MEDWSNIPTTKRSRRDYILPEKKKSLTTVVGQMWCGKCGISHLQNEPCRYPDVSKSLWCSICGGQQNDHVRGCPVEKGTSMIQICKKCEGEGHTQENCTTSGVPCYKCRQMGHLARECTQMERFALRHQIYDPPSKEAGPFCQHCKEKGHWLKDCVQVTQVTGKERVMNKYQEAYEELLPERSHSIYG